MATWKDSWIWSNQLHVHLFFSKLIGQSCYLPAQTPPYISVKILTQERERERERDHINGYIHTYMFADMYIVYSMCVETSN